MTRPACIRHWEEVPGEQSAISRTGEPLAVQRNFDELLGLKNLRVGRETLKPGHRSSSPHAHTTQDEFIFVLEGHPDIWIDGVLHRLGPGDGVAFPAGTGSAHTLINNSQHDVHVLALAALQAGDYCFYPFNEDTSNNPVVEEWSRRARGPHDGYSEQFRARFNPAKKTPNV